MTGSIRPTQRTAFTFLELLVVLVLIVFCSAISLAGLARARETANRVKCGSNLRQIGQAMMLYANENNGHYPRTFYDPKRDAPTAYTHSESANPFKDSPDANDVTAALFLLLRTQDLTAAVFVCPSDFRSPWDYGPKGNVQFVSNFPDANHLSYGLTNPYASEAAVKDGFKWKSDLKADFALAADINPGSDILTKLTDTSPREQIEKGNSNNHQREGQNVLYGDLHVDFTQSPLCGVDQDNIYTYGVSGAKQPTGGEGINGSPRHKGDSVILPVDTGRAAAATQLAAKMPTLPATPLAWTLDDAQHQLQLNPRDPYLQFVVLQLGLREGQNLASDIAAVSGRRGGRRDDAAQVDLFDLFSGAHGVQESLQLDVMTVREARRATSNPTTQPGDVALSSLAGPGVQSHPWEKMLAGRQPRVSAMSLRVPADFYLAEFQSLSKLLELIDASGSWESHLSSQALGSAQASDAPIRLRTQLVLKVDPLMRPFYDTVVADVAVTGSDLFLREGADVTLLFHVKQPDLFKVRMTALWAEAKQAHADAAEDAGEIDGTRYAHLATPDHQVDVYTADPAPDLHVRSNSKAALARVLASMKNNGEHALGHTPEFAYVRTLMTAGAPEEDGLLYLSDPFIHNLVGPKLKLTERRRLICYNHLRMAGHASMMFRTEFGRLPTSLKELADQGCAPDTFGEGSLACPDGGVYKILPDGSAACSVHGHAGGLTPCIDLPLQHITPVEANQYKAFVEQYNQYWRRFFDPIAIRAQVTPQRVRFETIILPLIDNSIYTSLANALKGAPAQLDSLPVPDRNIFTVSLKVDKKPLLDEVDGTERRGNGFVGELLGDNADPKLVRHFLSDGLGDHLGLHVYDAPQMFGFDIPGFLGDAFRSFGGNGGDRFGSEITYIAALLASLNAPVYLSVPVRDPKIVDEFLNSVDAGLAAKARQPVQFDFFPLSRDFYTLADRREIRCHVLHLGPVTWRLFWARIGNGFYIASKPFILDDLIAMEQKERAKPVAPALDSTGHALVRVRPRHWKQVLPDFQLSWSEGNRRACLDNLSPLSDVARSLSRPGDGKGAATQPAAVGDVMRAAATLHDARFFCPDGGEYHVSADGKSVECSVHGSPAHPMQSKMPDAQAAPSSLYGATGLAATLTFLEDGLHAVINIDRR